MYTTKELQDAVARPITKLREAVEASSARSAWTRGVKEYALDLVESLDEAVRGGYFDPFDLGAPKLLHRELLNGAGDWSQYSWGGCSLIYDADIAERLCTQSELKRTKCGRLRPNAREEWLDVQARALYQAEMLIFRVIEEGGIANV